MALLHIPLDQIDEARLQALNTAGAAESRTIDSERTIYGQTHTDYSEFLADTSSFANTSGGDLVIGMDATNGIPTAITALTTPLDPEILRLERFARGRLQPRVANIVFHAVPIEAGGTVLILHELTFCTCVRPKQRVQMKFIPYQCLKSAVRGTRRISDQSGVADRIPGRRA
jgi:hypothetical protein